MKTNRLYLALSLTALTFSLSSCLDFDDPEDTYQATNKKSEDVVMHGAADSINYLNYEPNQEGVLKHLC